MPSFTEDLALYKNRKQFGDDFGNYSFEQSTIYESIQISFDAWIRDLLTMVKNDCSTRTGNINVDFFTSNC